MTYQEILQAEKYLKEIATLQKEAINGKSIREEICNLNDRICTSFDNYSSVGIDWQDIMDDEYDGSDCIELVSIMDIMATALEALLNREPQYGTIKMVQQDIDRCASCSGKSKRNLILELVPKYSALIKFDKSIYSYIQTDCDVILFDRTEQIFKAVKGNLQLYLESLTMPKRITAAKEKATPVQVFNTQTNTQTVAVNLDVNIENCLKSLDDCETLTLEEIAEVKTQLDEIQELLKDKKGKKKTIREKIKSMLKWVADKGTDAMIALLPTIVSILTNLQVG